MTIKSRVKKLEDKALVEGKPFLVVSEQEGKLYAVPSQLPEQYRREVLPGDYLGQTITPEEYRELEGLRTILHIVYEERSIVPAREGEDVINMFSEDDNRQGLSCEDTV